VSEHPDVVKERLVACLATMAPALRAKYDEQVSETTGDLMRLTIAEHLKYQAALEEGRRLERISAADATPAAPGVHHTLYVLAVQALITEDQKARGIAEGKRRVEVAERKHLVSHFETDLERHIRGACGECVATENFILGERWDPLDRDFGIDIKPDFHVKTTHLDYGLRVVPQPNQRWTEGRYLHVFEQGDLYTLRGWLPARLVQDSRYPASAHNPAWTKGWVIPEHALWPVEMKP